MGRDEGREAGEPSLTEMSQQKITHTGSSGLIAGEMFVKGWCNGREKSLDFFSFSICVCSCGSVHLKCPFLSIFSPSVLKGSFQMSSSP